jgi:hypothetical protein
MAGGAGVYPNGAEGFWMGAVPPPGVYYLNYDLLYSSHRYNDNSSGEVDAGPLKGFTIDVFANVSRFLYVSRVNVFGGSWAAHVFIPYQDINFKSAGDNCHVSGLGDIIIDPFVVAWHRENLHMVSGIDIYCPTGDYEPGRAANLSANAFVYEPAFAVTYMTPLKGFTASAKFMYDIPEANKEFTHPFLPVSGELKYGQEFHFDYSLDYMINSEWKVGVGGYYLQQTTDDKLEGARIDNSKGRVFAVGPGVEYSKGKFITSFRTQLEMSAHNRAEGIANWLKVIYIF